MTKLDSILEALIKHGARLTGSWARGDEQCNSDYDFYVPERRWKEFVKAAPRGWESCIVGHIGYRTELGLIEVSSLFRNQRGKRAGAERVLLGVNWKTW